jgi:PAS domain S-box-containing protein
MPEKFHVFMDNSPSPAWIKDESFRYVYVNPIFEKLFELKLKNIHGKTDFEIWPQEVAAEFRANDLAVLSSNKPLQAVERSPGRTWLSCKFSFKDNAGRRYLGGEAIDLTGLKDAEEKIRFQASLLDQVRNAVVATDQAGKILYWNRFAEELYQWKASEAVGKNIMEITVPSESKALASGIMTQLIEDGFWEGEFLLMRKNGTRFTAFVTDSVLKNASGETVGIVGISVDMDEHKKAQKALEEKNIALKEILSQLEIEKKGIKEELASNIEKLIFPILKNMRKRQTLESSKPLGDYLDMLEQNLMELAGPMRSGFASQMSRLTLKEIEICNFIRSGLTNKEIAKVLEISPATVETHRVRIRRKLKINSREINLAGYLQAV